MAVRIEQTSVLVTGGGLPGINAALDLASQGFKVFLVEDAPSIGVVKTQLTNAFQTNDCSRCAFAPKMLECGRHPSIEIFTYSKIKEVKGKPGDFKVKVERKPRFIREDKCNGCGVCAQVCPVTVLNEYEQKIFSRKAVYLAFPQAYPMVYTIDRDRCIQCGQCRIVCERDAVDYDMKPETIEINVGAIIAAGGGDYYEPYDMPEYGYGILPDVISVQEFDKMLDPDGPTGGKILRPSDGKAARSIAFVQCVGSRENKGEAYCSSLCGTFASKELKALIMNSIIAKEQAEDVALFYRDIYSYGREFGEFHKMVMDQFGINYVRGKPGEIKQADGMLGIECEDSETGTIKTDLVVLGTAPLPLDDNKYLAEKLKIPLDGFGFIKEHDPYINPVDTSQPAVYACGSATGPRDVPDAIAQSSGAVAKSGIYVLPGEIHIEKELPVEISVRGEEPRVGVFLCTCGLNIGSIINMKELEEHTMTLPGVVHVETNMFTCSSETINNIREKIISEKLNRVVVASCTPKTHEPLFRETCMEAGLNKYLFEMANIREHCAWVHMTDSKGATRKAESLLSSAVARARLLEPRYELEVDINRSSLIIGGGIAGMAAALALSNRGFDAYIVEKSEDIGGMVGEIDIVPPYDIKAKEIVDTMVKEVKETRKINVFSSSTIKDVTGYIGNFEVTIDHKGEEETITVGTIIVASGAEVLKPAGMFGYQENRNVITQVELDKRIADGWIKDKKEIIMIQCVGARERDGRKYCSRVCCLDAIKNARRLKKELPDARIKVLHRGIRLVGWKEREYYQKSLEEGIEYIRFDADRPPAVTGDGRMKVEVFDREKDKKLIFDADCVVLSTPIVASDENKKTAKMLKVRYNEESKFFTEAHQKLKPVEFATDGIFMCGTAHWPKDIKDSVSQGLGAASKALNLMMRGNIQIEAITVDIDRDACIGCQACIPLCPYGAIKIEDDRATVIPALCKGCGACVVACPERAIIAHHFKDEYYRAQIEALLE